MQKLLIISDGSFAGTRIVDIEKGVDVKSLTGTSNSGNHSRIVLKYDESPTTLGVVTIERDSEPKPKKATPKKRRSRK